MKLRTMWFCICVVSASVLSANANLITNGTFDSNADGWTISTEAEGGGGFDGTRGNPVGSFLLNGFGLPDSDPFIEQTVSGLTIGQLYRLSWDLALHVNFDGSSVNGLSFGVFLDGANIRLTEQLTEDFVPDFVDFVATAESHTLRFAAELDARTPGVAGTTDVSYFIDNIALEVVPEPTTGLLVGLSLLGAAAMRRRP